mgnify:CR=1 FL=1
MAKTNILTRSKLKKADALLKQNKLPEAIEIYQKLCKLDGANAGLWSQLGILLRQTGRYAEAESCCRKAVQLSPASAIAHHALGAAAHSQDRLDEAVNCYRKAIQLQPDLVEAHYYLANALREQANVDGAADAYRTLLKVDPDHFEGLNNFGALLTNMARAEEAVKILTHALELSDDSVETLSNLARAHTLIGSKTVAIELLHKAIKLQPGFLNTYMELASALSSNGQYEESLRCFDTALELSPGNRWALVGKAMIYEKLGKNADAYLIIKPLLEDENFLGALPVFFDISRDIGLRDKAVSMIQKTLERDDINVAGTTHFHTRLGRHFDRESRYDEAFEHFSTANALANKRFNIDKTAVQFDSICRVYNEPFANNLPRSTNTSELEVFIVGMPRSGTSLVEQILATHPEIYGTGETANVKKLADQLSFRYSTDKFPGFVNKLSEYSLDRLADELQKAYPALPPRVKRVTDKTPQNFIYLGLILQLFPRCRIIHCKRNPLDTCLSCFFSDFGSIYHNYAYDLHSLGRYYGLYSKLMDHWTTVFPDRIFQVDYEELVENQEPVSRAMIAHCGMQWNDQCLDFHKLDRVINTISYNQVRQPLYKRSVNRWHNYDKHLTPLRAALDQSGVEY